MIRTLYTYITAATIALCCSCTAVLASHMAGGEMTYKYIKDSTIFGAQVHKYEVTLNLYADCTHASPGAIAFNDPAYITIYSGDSMHLDHLDSIARGSEETIPALYTGPCGIASSPNLPSLCLLKQTFTKFFYLPAGASSYTLVYQQCCRNTGPDNIIESGNAGATYYCTIPATPTAHNSSAVFSFYPAQALCLNTPGSAELTATDADGDSLSYELAAAIGSTVETVIKPAIFPPPPYNGIDYTPPFSAIDPLPGIAPLSVNALTGRMSITPTKVGRYLIAIACKEWRNGVLINTTRREFEWTVVDCGAFINDYKPYAGGDRTIAAGDVIYFNAIGAVGYSWSPASFLSAANIPNPTGKFTEQGTFTYVVHGVSDSGCSGDDQLTIHVLEHSAFAVPNAFTPNDDGINDVLYPRPIGNSVIKSFDIYNRLGNRVYSAPQYGGTWDGTYKGTKQEMGVYIWQLTYTDNTGELQIQSGNVTLLR